MLDDAGQTLYQHWAKTGAPCGFGGNVIHLMMLSRGNLKVSESKIEQKHASQSRSQGNADRQTNIRHWDDNSLQSEAEGLEMFDRLNY